MILLQPSWIQTRTWVFSALPKSKHSVIYDIPRHFGFQPLWEMSERWEGSDTVPSGAADSSAPAVSGRRQTRAWEVNVVLLR